MRIHIEHIEARSMLVLDGYENHVKLFNIRHCWVLLERYQKSQSPQNIPII